MKTVADVYREYRIMPSLQLHQLRVAAVAKLVCDNFKQSLDTNAVVLACLFHDMGNIIKSDLAAFPEFLKPEGLEYWRKVKAEFTERYGTNAHKANVAIAQEMGLSADVTELIDGISFSNVERIVMEDSWEQKISEYADDRVGPNGILPIGERLREARKRYIDSGKTYYTEEGFEKLAGFVHQLEQQVFAETHIKPEDITDSAVAPLIEELRNYPV